MTTATESPSTLVAILVAARKAGDRELERHARQALLERHNLKLTFGKPPTTEQGATDAR